MNNSFFSENSQGFGKTNLKARINLEKCKRCYKCVSRCQQNAIIMGENGYPKVDTKKCNGCQLCKKSCIDFYYENENNLKLNNKEIGFLVGKVENFLQKYNLLTSQNTLLVGFSGGYDSCFLLHILSHLREKYSFRLCAAHLNHGWRGKESDAEEDNCRHFCNKNSIDFYSEKLDENIPHTETSAREARYEFFSRAAEKFNTSILLTAHNKTDNSETLIYRIAKGTGIKGLCGIEEKRIFNNLIIYRPILDIERDEIEAYCLNNGLKPNNDSSNFDIKYQRNFIRHEIIPQLKRINQNVNSAVNVLCENAKDAEEIVQEYLKKISLEVFDGKTIKTNKFLKLSKAIQQRFIYNLIVENGLDYDRKKIFEIIDFVKNASKSKSGKTLSLTTGLYLFCSKNETYILKKSTDKKDLVVVIDDLQKSYEFANYKFTIEEYKNDAELIFPKENENYAYVDLSSQSYLELRFRKSGDKFQPFGMKHLIKLKDFFINKSVPKHKKDEIVLLCNNQEVLWACSVGLSEKLRVIEQPTHKIRIDEVRNDD